MRPTPLSRVRIIGTAQNICGFSAQAFHAKGHKHPNDQVGSELDRITLLENAVLFERDGWPDEMVPLSCIGAMRPVHDIKGELLDKESLAERKAAKDAADKLAELARRAAPPPVAAPAPTPVAATAVIRDDDGDMLRPEAAIRHEPAPTDKKIKRKGPTE